MGDYYGRDVQGRQVGSTYFFVDMDYTDKGVSSAYWEISRELKFWKAPVSAHVEYNGGLNYINNAFLGGATYSWNSSDFSKVFGVQVLYKYIQKNEKPHNFQLTGTWTLNFCKENLLSADLRISGVKNIRM